MPASQTSESTETKEYISGGGKMLVSHKVARGPSNSKRSSIGGMMAREHQQQLQVGAEAQKDGAAGVAGWSSTRVAVCNTSNRTLVKSSKAASYTESFP
jgi:hypothetical protein